jgi:single-strand DNA-binding protein
MKSMNKVQLIGYLGSDPEFKTMQDGTLMARMRLATDHWFFPKDGGRKQYTDWHTIKMWGKDQVERFRNYLIKGSHVLVEGRVIYRTYTDREGQTRNVTEIRANYLVDLDR